MRDLPRWLSAKYWDLPLSIQTLAGQGFKVMASIGSWNFPSHYFFEMVSTQHRRAKFITSAKAFLMQHDMAGIDIDWEFPRSAPRDNAVKLTNYLFRFLLGPPGAVGVRSGYFLLGPPGAFGFMWIFEACSDMCPMASFTEYVASCHRRCDGSSIV